MRSAEEAARLAAEWKVLRSSKSGASSSRSALEESEKGERPGRKRKTGKKFERRYERVESDENMEAVCRKQDVGLSFTRKIESSSNSSSPNGIGARDPYSSENAQIAVIKRTSLTT